VSERVFLDTNILVYADDLNAGEKNTIALALLDTTIRSGTAVLSTQVLQEFFVTAVKKLGVPAKTARRKVELLSKLSIVQVDVELILEAIDAHRLHQVSFWDALVLCAARVAGCARLMTEDLQHGQVLHGVRIENPFR
jgi:predicted nucleic acid-binding protein